MRRHEEPAEASASRPGRFDRHVHGHQDGRDLARRSLPGYRLPEFTHHNVNRFLYQSRLVEMTRDVAGDIVECGVGTGRTFLFWAHALYREASHRHLWGFDSFEGFPEPTPEDASPRGARAGEWKVTTLDDVYASLLASGLPSEFVRGRTTLVKGFFDDTLPTFPVKPVSLLYIDADLYRSYKAVFEHLYPNVSPGGVVAFDEYTGTWEHYPFPGAKRAIDEFLAGTGLELRRDAEFGKFYVVKPA